MTLIAALLCLLSVLLRERYLRRRTQWALRETCRLARIAKAWDPGPRQPEFYQTLAFYEQFAGDHEETDRGQGVHGDGAAAPQ
jgi:hypothetical protein